MPWVQPGAWRIQRRPRADPGGDRLSTETFTMTVDWCPRCKSSPKSHGRSAAVVVPRCDVRRTKPTSNDNGPRSTNTRSDGDSGLKWGITRRCFSSRPVCAESAEGPNRVGTGTALPVDCISITTTRQARSANYCAVAATKVLRDLGMIPRLWGRRSNISGPMRSRSSREHNCNYGRLGGPRKPAGGSGPWAQVTAFLTSLAIFASSAFVNFFSAKDVGHMSP